MRNRNVGFILIIIAAVLIEVTSFVQFWYAKEGIRNDVETHAISELRIKSLRIQNVMNETEVLVKSLADIVAHDLEKPEDMGDITRNILQNNPTIVGTAIAFEPYYYKEKGRQFSPYSYRDGDSIKTKQLGTEKYDYHNKEWYKVPFSKGEGHWSEPYFDEGGGEMVMSTYSFPVRDDSGKIVAVVTADISLDWLSNLINSGSRHASTQSMIISKTGRIMACPDPTAIMSKTLLQATSHFEDTTIRQVNREMLGGQSGKAEVSANNGNLYYVFYTPINLANDSDMAGLNDDDDSGWSIAIVCSDSEIYQGLRRLSFYLNILMLLGLALMGYIIYRTAKNDKHLAMVNSEKERIGSELRIASAIQQSMLPKDRASLPNSAHHKVDRDISGLLLSAKEVGGDLYDYYLNDNKLFFCIGDVSGKGVPASLMMAMTRSLFRSVSAHTHAPRKIARDINITMSENNETGMFVTFFVGVLDLVTGHLRYCNAGHCPPLLLNRTDHSVTTLPVEPNIPIGVTAEWEYTEQEADLQIGTTIFLYTDGLTEAENRDHVLFGEKSMLYAAHMALLGNDFDAVSLINDMKESVNTFVNHAVQSDDLTMLAVTYHPTLILPNDIQTQPQLTEFVEKVCEGKEIDEITVMQVNLALEEAVVNVMKYAYPEGTKGEVCIRAMAEEKQLTFLIIDNGEPFDPTQKEDADTSLSAEDRPIGGLGIHLIRQIMTSISYNRINGNNILTLTKQL